LIEDIGKKEAMLRLQDKKKSTKSDLKNLHLIWCVIDPKVIYSTLPMLNQIGVSKISFVYCDRSQKNFKIDLDKCQKILTNSSGQCGRTDLMKIEVLNNLDYLFEKYKDFAVLDFGGETSWQSISSVMIGCEGGFSEQEREKLQSNYKIGFKTGLILKSETAALTIASKLLI
jgi:16S rRNA (uracil1498-N3)-methyltransferase